jgi:RNA polymerase sigma factor (sigma-70 family)
MSDGYERDFDAREIAVAKAVVRRFLATRPCPRGYDAEDLLQECLIHWFRCRDGYDPKGGASRETYMAFVLERRLHEILRAQLADVRRANQTAVSLDSPADKSEPDRTLGDTLYGPDPLHDIPLKLALERVFEDLTPSQRAICIGLLSGESMAKIAETLGRMRTTLYCDDIKRIRRMFEKAGLEDFLK